MSVNKKGQILVCFSSVFQAVDQLKSGSLAVEAVAAALVELEVGHYSCINFLPLTLYKCM